MGISRPGHYRAGIDTLGVERCGVAELHERLRSGRRSDLRDAHVTLADHGAATHDGFEVARFGVHAMDSLIGELMKQAAPVTPGKCGADVAAS